MITRDHDISSELNAFLHSHLDELDSPGRIRALVTYCAGLGLALEAKTALGIAKHFEPENVQGCRQRIQKALGHGRSEGATIFSRLRRTVFTTTEFDALIFDDTGIAKQGERSVGVARQYCGKSGKIDNCQVAVSMHASSDMRSCMVDAELYLPKQWLDEDHRCDTLIPETIRYRSKIDIAIEMLDRACRESSLQFPVLADAGYGDSHAFRQAIAARGLRYALGISGKHLVWHADTEFAVPTTRAPGQSGPQPRKWRATSGERPILVSELGHQLAAAGMLNHAPWRKGVRGAATAKFAAIRVFCANARSQGQAHPEELWLLIEDRDGQGEQLRYYFLNFPADTSLQDLVAWTKRRWRIEYDYREMKQHLGLEAYEGRFWDGFHRHLALVALMHAFVSLHREAFSPSG